MTNTINTTYSITFFYDNQLDMYVPTNIRSYPALDGINTRHVDFDNNGNPNMYNTEVQLEQVSGFYIPPTVQDYHNDHCQYKNNRWEFIK
jgi:hypothetical protein